MKKIYLVTFLSLFFLNIGWSQDSSIHLKTQNYLEAHASEMGLELSDVQDLTVQTNYTDEKTKVEYAYVQQNLAGYPVYGAIANFALKNGKIVYANQTFQKDIMQRIGNQSAELNLEIISAKILQNLGYILNETAFVNSEFTNELFYFPSTEGKLNLSWMIHFNINSGTELLILEVIANAKTGEIYHQHNQLLSCSFEASPFENPLTDFKESKEVSWLNQQFNNSTLNDGAKYNVYAFPTEAPTFGGRSVVENPADDLASPYGWHSFDGIEGHNLNKTEGNNVMAVNDQNSAALSWLFEGTSYSPTGFAESGPDLNFNFPIDLTRNMYESKDASTTNLFYANNMMHDVWYNYGFTEEAGNFQFSNLDKGGLEGDYVYAFGQTGETLGYKNNAMFGTPSDGGNPFMIMFMWDSNEDDSHLFSVNTAGTYQGNYNGTLANFGPGMYTPPITANLAVVIDDNANGGTDENDGCENITNAADLNGKIALIRRGNCDFVTKVKSAQNAGAVAVVMVNNVTGAPIPMGGEDLTITIPSVMISNADGDPIMDAVLDGTTLNGSVPKDGHWDGYKDGTLDNGIMAHEYGHGISNRLTGGPANSNCLNNQEQMGEGWSDYFALVMTMNTGDQGTDGRGIGTYAVSQPTTGVGIRPTRYSTDMSINPSTYNKIKTAAVPHGVGYVWATMLWEMTWALIDEYGYDPNIMNGSGGNNLAMQLVMDGMKLQPCGPGFVTGRDAILQADINNNDGENQCTIWKAFAKRGLGYSANQGNANSTSDGTEAFDMPPNEVLACEMGTNDLLNQEISLYPNPTKGELYILTDSAQSQANISIQDLTGRTVFETVAELQHKRTTIDVSSLSAGVYVIKIQTKEGTVTKKLIKK